MAALTGFQLAMVLSTAGMCWVATMALDTNATGNSTMRPMPCADSGPWALAHDSA